MRLARADLAPCAYLCFCAALQQESSAEAFQEIGDWDLYFDRCELMRLLNEEGTYTAAVSQGPARKTAGLLVGGGGTRRR